MEISEYLRSLGDSGLQIKLFRVDRTGRGSFLNLLPYEALADATIETAIRDEYGGGTYRIQVTKNGKWLKGSNKLINIEQEYDPTLPAAPPQEYGTATAANAQLRMMELQMAATRESAERQIQMMQGFNQSIMGIMTAVITSARPMDPIALAQLLQGNKSDQNPLAMVREVLALTKELNPGGAGPAEPEDIYAEIIKGAIPALITGITNRTQAAPPVANPPQQQIEARSEEPPPPTGEDKTMEERLKFLALLKAKAAAGAEPAYWADYIEDNQDEAAAAWILATVEKWDFATIWKALLATDKTLAAHKQWFEVLFELLRNPEAKPPTETDMHAAFVAQSVEPEK